MLAEDHKRLIVEGVHVMESVNETLPPEHRPFSVLGDVNTPNSMNF
jgi:hypothetical protein